MIYDRHGRPYQQLARAVRAVREGEGIATGFPLLDSVQPVALVDDLRETVPPSDLSVEWALEVTSPIPGAGNAADVLLRLNVGVWVREVRATSAARVFLPDPGLGVQFGGAAVVPPTFRGGAARVSVSTGFLIGVLAGGFPLAVGVAWPAVPTFVPAGQFVRVQSAALNAALSVTLHVVELPQG